MLWKNAPGRSAAAVSLSWYASSVLMMKKESVMMVGDAASSLQIYACCSAPFMHVCPFKLLFFISFRMISKEIVFTPSSQVRDWELWGMNDCISCSCVISLSVLTSPLFPKAFSSTFRLNGSLKTPGRQVCPLSPGSWLLGPGCLAQWCWVWCSLCICCLAFMHIVTWGTPANTPHLYQSCHPLPAPGCWPAHGHPVLCFFHVGFIIRVGVIFGYLQGWYCFEGYLCLVVNWVVWV